MKRFFLFILLSSTFVLYMCFNENDSNFVKHELDAIEELHKKDKMASLNGDIEELLSLFTDDGIVIPPEGEIIKGKENLRKMLVQNRDQLKEYKLTEYLHDFKEIKVIGEYAYEWGTYSGKYKLKKGHEEIKGSGKLLRILVKQKDGSWKVSRSIWNVEK